MAARSPRRSFAAPFVVTLAAAPACYVQSTPPPQQPAPAPPQTAEPAPPPDTQTPPVIVNPPRPQPQTQPPARPPRPASTQQLKWSVFKVPDGSCNAAIDVQCDPKATCNPPPPFKYTCPANVSLAQTITIVSYDGGASCFVERELPKCPPNTACNPPPPQSVACPKR